MLIVRLFKGFYSHSCITSGVNKKQEGLECLFLLSSLNVFVCFLPTCCSFCVLVIYGVCVCFHSKALRTQQQEPALTMTTAGTWTRIKWGSRSNSFCHREDTTARGSSSTPCSLRYTSPLPVSALLQDGDLFIDLCNHYTRERDEEICLFLGKMFF